MGRKRCGPAMKLYLKPQLILQSVLELEWAFIVANQGKGSDPYAPLVFLEAIDVTHFKDPLLSCKAPLWSVTTVSVLSASSNGSEQVNPLKGGMNLGKAFPTTKGSFQNRTQLWSSSQGMGVLSLKRAAPL